MKKGSNRILITGAAGFIGAEVVKRFLKNKEKVLGIDNLNNYYDVNLKLARLKNIENIKDISKDDWFFKNLNIEEFYNLKKNCDEFNPNIVVHLAAQAGVRYSIEKPNEYIKSNLLGFGNILEICRHADIENFIYASSSSVYGGNKKLPFNEDYPVDHPLSLYAATKKSNEVMAHSYSSLFNIPTTGLRFFTVYGPWGRPDMAPMIFADSILKKKPIKVFNDGKMKRDFTFIDDIVDGIIGCSYKKTTNNDQFDYQNPTPSSSFAPNRVFNIGCSKPVELEYFINLLENTFGIKAIKKYYPMQKGDLKETYADIKKLVEWIHYDPKVKIEDGVSRFAKWYLSYHKIKN